MNRDCKQGLRLRLHFEHTLKEWGWFDAYEQALELMPVGPPQVHEFQQEAQHAHSELIKARRAYIEHMASLSRLQQTAYHFRRRGLDP